MIAIFSSYADEHRIRVSRGVDAAIRTFIEHAPDQVRIGNGRFVRNIFEQMYSRMAVRVAADGVITDEELEAFEIDDVPAVSQLTSYESWGFARGAPAAGP